MHAENKSHLPHLCFPGERHWERGDRKRKTKSISVYQARPGERTVLTPLGHSHLLLPPRPCVPRGAHPAQAAPLAGPLTAPTTPPAAGPAATGHRVLAWDRATRALNPPGALGHRPRLSQRGSRSQAPVPAARPHSSFSGELCLQLEIRGQLGAREQLQALQPLYFSPAGQVASGQHLWLPAGCSLFLLNPPLWFLHRAGLSWA